MSKLFTANSSALSLDKMNITKLIMNTFAEYPVSAGYDEKYIEEPLRTKLFGL